MRSLLIFIFLTISLLTNSQIIRIKIDPSIDKTTKIYLSELASEVQYLRLDTKPECMISEVSKVLIDNDIVLVKTYSIDEERLYMFSSEGKFIRQIGKIGRGPEEYLSINDFTLDKDKNIIYFIDSFGKLFVYDYSGKIIRTQKLTSSPTKIEYFNNTLFLLTAWPLYFYNNGFALSILDLSNNKVKFTLLNRDYLQLNGFNKNTLVYSNMFLGVNRDNSVSILEEKFDTLYHVSENGKVDPKYVIDLARKIPRDIITQIERANAISSYSTYSSIIETTMHLIFTVVDKKEFYIYFYNKLTRKALMQNTNKLKQCIFNDYDGGLSFNPRGLADVNTLYSVVSSQKIKEKMETVGQTNSVITNQKAYKTLLEIAKTADPNDNPIIMLVKLKQ